MSDSRIKKKACYGLADKMNNDECRHFGIQFGHQSDMRVTCTGEFRTPKRGEWYLSGAIIAGYRALNDLTTAFHIGKLVKVKVETVVTVIQED